MLFICSELGIEEAELRSDLRTQDVIHARKIAYFALRDIAKMTLSSIARMFDRHHTSIMYLLDRPPTDEQSSRVLRRAAAFWSGESYDID